MDSSELCKTGDSKSANQNKNKMGFPVVLILEPPNMSQDSQIYLSVPVLQPSYPVSDFEV